MRDTHVNDGGKTRMTSTISMGAAYRIWTAHREIEVGEKLLADIAKTLAEGGDPSPYEPSGRHRRGYSLGVPSGSGERILNVSPRLAAAVIEAHIAEKQRDLIEATIAARLEIEAATTER
jgi:hypothetical protein